MQVRIIIQTNRDTGQKNVVLTMDKLAPVEDFLVGSWPNSDVIEGIVLLLCLGDDTIVDGLLDTELRSVDGPAFGGAVSVTPEIEARCRALLKGV
jgi:hypothetical protein